MSSKLEEKIGVIGLGYVGLPLAALFAEKCEVLGYDVNEARVQELSCGEDHTLEVESEKLKHANLSFTSKEEDLTSCTFIIVAVPSPINISREPDLTCLLKASETVGRILRKGMCVVFESTVYPGVTEDDCLPIMEKTSGLKLGEFQLGYSPERVNPGDKERTIDRIVKIVSGHNEETLARVAKVYGSIITVGVHQAPTIKTAEAAKVIENVQRDLNIALMNELSKIFARLDLDTNDVLDAAATKWNFHRYHPGLVGGHCIGVDPYYLTHRALELGYHPEVILAGRRVNDNMGNYVGDLAIREISFAGTAPSKAHVWVLGMTFKENVPDFRNTRSVDVVKFLQQHGCKVSVWEPLVSAEQIKEQFDLETLTYDEIENIDAVILINGHDHYSCIDLATLKTKMKTPVLVDVKSYFDKKQAAELGYRYIRL